MSALNIMKFLGRRLKEIRHERGLTLDDIATASQHFGTNWTSATISSMERGGSNIARLDVLMILTEAVTFTDDNGDVAPMVLADWFSIWGKEDGQDVVIAENDTISLNDELSTSRNNVAAALEGQPPTLFPLIGTKEQREELYRTVDMKDSAPANTEKKPHVPDRLRGNAHVATLSEQRAAIKFGLSPELFACVVKMRYGHYLDEEVAKRAGADASPQKRGRVTRKIFEELGDHLTLEETARASAVLRRQKASAENDLAALRGIIPRHTGITGVYRRSTDSSCCRKVSEVSE
ncbi:helix-turn-helix domain-containing protein [Bifidobacterium pseudolongum]|nr:helix-turn-helix transcriptional regulator [Bifidobacterium pseudolongum]